MTKFATALTAAMFAFATPANAQSEQQLPSCDSTEVRRVFSGIVRPNSVYEQKDLRSGDEKKRWCYVFFSGPRPGMGFMAGSPYQEAAFTIEWMNQSEGRWWLEIRERQESCRGTLNGGPDDKSRCQ